MLLFTPGPTPIPENIRKAMSRPTIHHRTPEFERLFEDCRSSLLALLGMHEVLMLASSGTGAMEACMTSLCTKKALTINSGKFGERFSKIAESLKIPYVEIKNEWDTPASVEEVISIIKNDKDIDAVFLQACESAGGLRHPFEEIALAVKEVNPDIMVIVDCITTLGVEFIDVHDIDAVIGGSQKAFMLPPGLSFIGLSEPAVDLIEERNVGYYFNLKTELKNQRKNTTAYTPATTIIEGLYSYFEQANQIGFNYIYQQTRSRSLATQEALREIGLKIYPKNPAVAMTTIIDEKNAESIRKVLKSEYHVNIAGGQDHLKGKIFRINHMGAIPIHESAWVLNAIELALEKLGIRPFDGRANYIFMKRFYGEIQTKNCFGQLG
ncbi:aminotransferase [Helicobacter monodelphidis]|uniref:pyridoxal-phosphate-dependent aminotransferase family protein n=1 Tax=Helicobacter sp. 15-1451 TaxID=2004995 RepID=UPI000DCBD4E1|nr:alanine--glyoxylate aminotransferase family protein [Helicobacter sp. 15-1451]RAX56868.1 aminotransferase [Helicobacter sp. 15-1451]